jgi:hypothetical protein
MQLQRRLVNKRPQSAGQIPRYAPPSFKPRVRQMRGLGIQPHTARADKMRRAPVFESHANQIHRARLRMQKRIRGAHRIARNPQIPRNVIPIARRENSRDRFGAVHALDDMMKRAVAPKRHHITIPCRRGFRGLLTHILRALRVDKLDASSLLGQIARYQRLRTQRAPSARSRIHNYECVGFHANFMRASDEIKR